MEPLSDMESRILDILAAGPEDLLRVEAGQWGVARTPNDPRLDAIRAEAVKMAAEKQKAAEADYRASDARVARPETGYVLIHVGDGGILPGSLARWEGDTLVADDHGDVVLHGAEVVRVPATVARPIPGTNGLCWLRVVVRQPGV